MCKFMASPDRYISSASGARPSKCQTMSGKGMAGRRRTLRGRKANQPWVDFALYPRCLLSTDIVGSDETPRAAAVILFMSCAYMDTTIIFAHAIYYWDKSSSHNRAVCAQRPRKFLLPILAPHVCHPQYSRLTPRDASDRLVIG